MTPKFTLAFDKIVPMTLNLKSTSPNQLGNSQSENVFGLDLKLNVQTYPSVNVVALVISGVLLKSAWSYLKY